MAETRWLDSDQQQTWRTFLEAVQLLLEETDRQLRADAGLSHADYELLVRLSEAPDRRLRMSFLSERTLFSRSRLSHAVSRLEREGWVERQACPGDRRGTFAALTDAGLAVLRGAAPGHVDTVRDALVDRLGPEQLAQLGAISAQVRDGLLQRRGPDVTTATPADATP